MRRLLLFLAGLPAAGLIFTYAYAQTVQTPDPLDLQVEELAKNADYEGIVRLLEPATQEAGRRRDYHKLVDLSIDLADACTELPDYARALRFLSDTRGILEKAGQTDSLYAARLFSWIGYVHRMQEQFPDALKAYQKAIDVFEGNRFNGPGLANAYKSAAQILLRRSDNRSAIRYLEAALRSDSTQTRRAGVYAQLANAYYFLDSLAPADHYYTLGMAEPDRSASNTASLNDIGAVLARIHGDTATARRLLFDALAYYETIPDKGDNRVRTLTALAEIAWKQHKHADAATFYQKAEAAGLEFYKNKSREMAILYIATGNFYEQTGRLDEALRFYQKAVIQVFPGFNDEHLNTNPDPNTRPLEAQAMQATAAKALALLKKKDLNPADRQNAAQCFSLAFAIAGKLRKTYGLDADKLTLAANNQAWYTAAAQNLWQWYRTSADATLLEQLFTLFEETRARVLSDALQQQQAFALAGIPDTLLAREAELRLQVAEARGQLDRENLLEKSGRTAETKVLQDRLSVLEKAYTEFIRKLEEQHSAFREFVQADSTVGMEAVRRTLAPGALLLCWFDAGDRYLCLALQHRTLSAYEVLRDTVFEQSLNRALSSLSDRTRQAGRADEFFNDAWLLKQRLLPDTLLAGTNALIIVPAGPLNYLPFETLLTAPYSGSFGSAPYLLRTHTLQYGWSAGLAAQNRALQKQGSGILQVSPFIEKSKAGLALLPDSGRELPEQFQKDVLIGQEAPAGPVLQAAGRYAVLHLSTHADAGQGREPGIEFFDRPVLLSEIYAQRLHASLVSLSACETGIGKSAAGEGVLSLAHGFAYAGARSLVAGLWSVNERQTAELFRLFYENLDQGMRKSEALRQAKLSLLSASGPDARKAPFYWAAFTLTGEDGPVDMRGGGNRLLWWLSAAAAGLAAFWWFRKKRGTRRAGSVV